MMHEAIIMSFEGGVLVSNPTGMFFTNLAQCVTAVYNATHQLVTEGHAVVGAYCLLGMPS